MSDDVKQVRTVRYRVVHRLGDSGKENLGWIQKRRWYDFFLPSKLQGIEWFPADNRRRKAAADFIEAVKRAQEMLRIYDDSTKDNEEALKYIRSYNQRAGISQWYEGELVPCEELLPDCTPEFEKLRKQFESGMGAEANGRRTRTPEHATKTEYYWPSGRALPHTRVEGRDLDHEIEYRPPQKDNQQGGRKRQQHRQQQDGNQQN